METLVNPSEDGSGARITVALQTRQLWRESRAQLQESMVNESAHSDAVAGHQREYSCAHSSGIMITIEKLKRQKEN